MKRYKVFLLLLVFILMSVSLQAQAKPKIITTHAITMHGTPKYKAGFKHFDYVNPDAPKGGTIVLSAIGTFDSFNSYAQRGTRPSGITGLYDSLLTVSADEVGVYYCLVAEKMEYPEDFKWIIYHINPQARFQDGKPITAEDVVFTFYKFMDQGVSQFKQAYENVQKVEAIDRLKVKYTLKETDKDMLISVGTSPVLPKHYWQSRDLAEPMTEVPLGSGPYVVKDYKMGQYIVYERLKNYWAMDIPVIKGQLNFDYLKYDYYRDETVLLEAFKAGEYDFRQEYISKNWATLYTGSAFDAGSIVKEEIPHELPQHMQALVFNVQRPMFKDRRVRMALNYALDFEWANKNLFYNQYKRLRSYFQNTKYAATGLPGKEELRILQPLRNKIPPEVFTKEYQPPKTDGSGNIRTQIRQALTLLKQAGWELKNNKLVNVKTGQPMEFELLYRQASLDRIFIPTQKNMEKMGITMNLRLVDATQYINRIRERDFDMVSSYYLTDHYPTDSLQIVWHSDYIDSTWNTAGVQDEAVDSLVEGIVKYQDNEEMLLHYGRALDRVLTWNHFVIPEWYINSWRVAYWNKFSKPKIRPKYDLGLDTWWIDTRKEKKLPKK